MSYDFAEEQRVAQRQRQAMRAATKQAAEIAPSVESEPAENAVLERPKSELRKMADRAGFDGSRSPQLEEVVNAFATGLANWLRSQRVYQEEEV